MPNQKAQWGDFHWVLSWGSWNEGMDICRDTGGTQFWHDGVKLRLGGLRLGVGGSEPVGNM